MDTEADHDATIRVRRLAPERCSHAQLESEPGTQFGERAHADGAPGRLPRRGPWLLPSLEVPRRHTVDFQNARRISAHHEGKRRRERNIDPRCAGPSGSV